MHNSIITATPVPDLTDVPNVPQHFADSVGNLERFVVMRFANAAARTAALPAPSCVAGMITYLTDTALFYLWTGAGWVQWPTGVGIETGDLITSARAAKTGFLLCNGASVSRVTYADLFGVIGVQYGSVDVNTFNVPNLVGKAAFGAGGGMALASTGGEAAHTLTLAELAAHAHGINHDHGNIQLPFSDSGIGPDYSMATGLGIDGAFGVDNPAFAGNSANAGAGTPHNNMPPYVALNYLIKT